MLYSWCLHILIRLTLGYLCGERQAKCKQSQY